MRTQIIAYPLQTVKIDLNSTLYNGIIELFSIFALIKREAMNVVLQYVKQKVDDRFHPDGYNVSINVGEYAGQSVFHCHMHLIPRYKGDVPNPKGGVMGVVNRDINTNNFKLLDMKKWLIFGGGIVTGVVLTFLFAFLFSSSCSDSNDGATWFEEPGDVIELESFKVFQVLDKDAALVRGASLDLGVVYLLTNDGDKYYYDDELIKVPDGKVVRQVGIYQYQTKSEFKKTVPIIQIMDK